MDIKTYFEPVVGTPFLSTPSGNAVSIEDLYQAFKARMLEEQKEKEELVNAILDADRKARLEMRRDR